MTREAPRNQHPCHAQYASLHQAVRRGVAQTTVRLAQRSLSACQVEEAYISAEELCRVVQQEAGAVLHSELVLLQGLRFDLIVHSLLRPLDGFFRDLQACRSMASGISAATSCKPGSNGYENGRADGSCVSAKQQLSSGVPSPADGQGSGDLPQLDDALLQVSDEQMARARGAAVAAADALLLTDAPLLFPPGQLALAAMRAGFRKVRAAYYLTHDRRMKGTVKNKVPHVDNALRRFSSDSAATLRG